MSGRDVAEWREAGRQVFAVEVKEVRSSLGMGKWGTYLESCRKDAR